MNDSSAGSSSVRMDDSAADAYPVEARPADTAAQADPYDGVALGVECAWPIEAGFQL